MNYRFKMKTAAIALCAVVAVGCESGMRSPVSPSAVVDVAAALNADGSNLKASAPLAISPVFEATAVSFTPTLAARAAGGRYGTVALAQRFQVADSDSFSNILSTGIGSIDASGVTRFTVEPALPANKRVLWRVRGEMGDAVGPWSNVMAFTTASPTGTAVPTPGPTTGTEPGVGPRPADPPPGTRLRLPDARPFINAMAGQLGTLPSCPFGRKYSSNPWLDKLIDNLRATDARWGYNGKPTRQAIHNDGIPVTCAGDEISYHYGAGPSQGSPEVYLIDTLGGHCGPTPAVTYRDFTGEEPGFWTLTRTPAR